MRILLLIAAFFIVSHASTFCSNLEKEKILLQLRDNAEAAASKLKHHVIKIAEKECESEIDINQAKNAYEAAKAFVDELQLNITSIDEELKKAETAQDARKTELNTTIAENGRLQAKVDEAFAAYKTAVSAAYEAMLDENEDEAKVQELQRKEDEAKKERIAAVVAKKVSDVKVTQAQQAVVTAEQLHQNLTIGRVFLEAQKGIAETEARTKKTISDNANQPVDEKLVTKVKNELEQLRTELVKVQNEKDDAEKLYNEANKKPDNGIPANFALVPFVMVLMSFW